MTPKQKDDLIRDILVLENSIISPKDDREISLHFIKQFQNCYLTMDLKPYLIQILTQPNLTSCV